MLKNYFKIAYRNISKNKLNSIINITGLAIGLTCVMLIGLYIKSEINIDRNFKDADRIYRVNMNGKNGADEFFAAVTPPPAGAALRDNFPEVESFTRIYKPNNVVVRNGSLHEMKSFIEKDVFAVDTNFLQVLNYPLKYGNAATCLHSQNAMVISEEVAKKYFGDTDPIGKMLTTDISKNPFTITAVLRNPTSNASLNFNILIPVSNCADVKHFDWSWVWLQMTTYIKLKKQAAADPNIIKKLQQRFPAMMKVQAANSFKRVGQPYDEFLKKGGKWNLILQPLKRVHLFSANEFSSAITNHGDAKSIYILGVIALFILVLGCVNFMNLATAQFAKRSKEVGIRKVLGSDRKQLIIQFLTEAMLFCFLSLLIALIAILLLQPFFNQLAGKSIQSSDLFHDGFWLIILSIVIITGLLAGSYPAFYLTSFKPIVALKTNASLKSKTSNLLVRNGLVILQFTISITLIISTLIVYNQLKYTQNRDLGFDKEHILILPNAARLGNSEEIFRQEISQLPQIKNASISTSMFTKGSFGDFYVPEINNPDEHIAKDITLGSYLIDDEFINTMNLKILKGRGFDKRFNDSLSVIINEATAKQIGWKNPIGRTIRYPGDKNQIYKVVGLVKDFNFESLHDAIVPFAFFQASSKSYDTSTSFIIAKLNAADPTTIIRQLESKWKSYLPSVPFDYSFLDSDLQAQYKSDQQIGVLFEVFTVISIFIACLGLFALVSYTTAQRAKEIGIRKVLGATVSNIVTLISSAFLKLIVLSIIIASPIAYFAMQKWLQDFAYRINISAWVFLLSGVLAIFIALLTISFQAVKAALANPVKSLRSE